MPSNLRFALVACALASTAIFLQARPGQEVFPSRSQLASLPKQLGLWRGTDLPITKDVLTVLGTGDFLSRSYGRDSIKTRIELFFAYFPSQSSGDTIHSPQHCLPGSGWSPLESRQVRLSLPGHNPFWANRYLLSRAGERELVLYWYWAHDRAVANEYWAKFFLVADSIRLHRSDGSLIRISTSIRGDESADSAQQRLVSFAKELVPIIDTYVPR